MNGNADKTKILFEQMKHLHDRSRWYTAQLWQVPFAYLGLTALAIGNALKENVSRLALFLIVAASAAFGAFVLKHIGVLEKAEERAVKHLERIEEMIRALAKSEFDLEIDKTVEFKERASSHLKTFVTIITATLAITSVVLGLLVIFDLLRRLCLLTTNGARG